MSEVVPGCRLDYFSKNLIERAVDQVAKSGDVTKVEIEHNGQKYRVLISKAVDHQAALEERSASRNHA